MTDPVTPVTSSPVVQTAPRPTPQPASPTASASPEPATPAEPQRPPLTVDVQRDAGVFVYTLRDPVTDTVLAVIPREAVQLHRDGRNLDQRV